MENHRSVTIDLELYHYLTSKAKPFESRNSVLRRLLKMPPSKETRGMKPKTEKKAAVA